MKRIEKAMSQLQPVIEDQELPLHFQSRLRHLLRGLEILGVEVGRWQEGKAKTLANPASTPQPSSLLDK